MTIYIPDLTSGNKIAFNGDFIGWNHYRLQLISNYTNKQLEPSGGFGSFEWLFELWFDQGNERYTEFTITSILPVPSSGEYEGFYTYNLYGTMTDADRYDPFVPADWTVLHTGLIKLVQTGSEENPFKNTYVGPNDSGESYVIYKP